MKIGLAQIDPTIGDFEGNRHRMTAMADRAKAAGCGLVVFSEMTITGYPPRDLLDKPDFIDGNLAAGDRLINSVTGIGLIFGLVTRNQSHVGRRLHNTALCCKDGRVIATTHKMLLPTYDVFDETRYFQPGEQAVDFEYGDMRFGLTVCEDIWNDADFFDTCFYGRDPVAQLARRRIDLLINISASPYHVDKRDFKWRMYRNLVGKYGIGLVTVNQVGGNDDILFDGVSLVMGAAGDVRAMAAEFKEDLVVYDTETGQGDIRTVPEEVEPSLYQALTLGVRDYFRKCGFTRAVIGLSGGIDSSLVAAVAVSALGPENVMGVAMPSQYTSQASKDDAAALARNLDIDFKVVPITPIFEAYLKDLSPVFAGRGPNETEENIQARIRGNILMAISNKFGHLVLSTGNKSEMAVGYCTLYGDMSGGLAVIADVPKTMVYRLARYVNQDKTVIPERVLTRPPTAELRPDQKDEDSLPPYDLLDAILHLYVEKIQPPEEIIAAGYPAEVVHQVARMVDRNEYKRKQAAMCLKVTSKAFGTGRRYPVAYKF
ncbi:MAG: NAD+ synthase [Deltaproteobacteria bacterium]|nr:NAD+ synthase [Deltaproteobacteria bacterium]